jgi:predicted nucleic acid-binding protein
VLICRSSFPITRHLNLLVRVRQIGILPALFGRVIIPNEVALEMAHPKAPDDVRQFIAAIPDWLVIQAPIHALDFPTLDAGESAAIALALELHAPLMIDERDGRIIARARGLEVIGAIGVLERAADQGLIADLTAVYQEIRTLRFHIADSVLAASLQRHQTK